MIDLCKLFGVEEGEEFKFNIGEAYYKYIISCNELVYYEELTKEWVKSCKSIFINDLPNLNIIKLPKKKEFTDDELDILKKIPKKYKWCARDKNKALYFHTDKPYKLDGFRFWRSSNRCVSIEVFNDLFPTILWEDEEPLFIDDYVERGVENE